MAHAHDVADAIVRSLDAAVKGHVRLTLCGPGEPDTKRR